MLPWRFCRSRKRTRSGNYEHRQKTAPKYMSVSWLSNYSGEFENLFIQNNELARDALAVRNIFHLKQDLDFKY